MSQAGGTLATLIPERTPARPGPGRLPAEALRALELAVRRRVDSLLAGELRSVQSGVASELDRIRGYEVGDDVRQIDWSATARTGQAHVRVHVAERALTTWLVLDGSASMQFGTAHRRKADVAEGVTLALGHVATRRGNRLGLVTFGAGSAQVAPPRQGRGGLVSALLAVRQQADGGEDGSTSLGAALEHAARHARQRAHLVIVSDLRGPRDWEEALGRVCHRHDVVVVEVRDPREERLVAVGELTLVDPETGRQLRVDTRDARLLERFALAAAAERAEVAAGVRSAGATHVVLRTDGDWLRGLLVGLGRKRRQ